jgi:hypothetical protein
LLFFVLRSRNQAYVKPREEASRLRIRKLNGIDVKEKAKKAKPKGKKKKAVFRVVSKASGVEDLAVESDGDGSGAEAEEEDEGEHESDDEERPAAK